MTRDLPDSVEFPLRGIFSALVTPLTARDQVHHDALARLIEDLIGQGVHGLIPLGSTGEYYALTPREREQVIRTAVESAAGRVPVIAGTNAGSTADVVRFSLQAQELGCAGVMLAPPYYSLPTEDELFEHFRAVDQVLEIPIMLYNYPGRTGVDMRPRFLEQLADLEHIAYVKESTGDATRISALIRRCGGRLGVFCGCDTLALESFVAGAIGWVGGVVNVTPAAHVKLFDLCAREHDYVEARRRFHELLPLLDRIEGGGKYTQFVKAACQLLGHDVGPPRPPLRPATPDEVESLRTDLAPWLLG